MLAAIYYALGRLAAALGVDMTDVDRIACDAKKVRPRKVPEPTPEERERRDDEETRREFAPILARAKEELKRKEKGASVC